MVKYFKKIVIEELEKMVNYVVNTQDDKNNLRHVINHDLGLIYLNYGKHRYPKEIEECVQHVEEKCGNIKSRLVGTLFAQRHMKPLLNSDPHIEVIQDIKYTCIKYYNCYRQYDWFHVDNIKLVREYANGCPSSSIIEELCSNFSDLYSKFRKNEEFVKICASIVYLHHN